METTWDLLNCPKPLPSDTIDQSGHRHMTGYKDNPTIMEREEPPRQLYKLQGYHTAQQSVCTHTANKDLPPTTAEAETTAKWLHTGEVELWPGIWL